MNKTTRIFARSYSENDPTGKMAVEGDPNAEQDPPESPTSVYYLFTKDHVLLYVGITSRGMVRHAEHALDKSWWQQVSYSSFEHYPNRVYAELREAAAIEHMKPLHNKQTGNRNPSWSAIHATRGFCIFPDCDRPIHAKKLCAKHYQRQQQSNRAS